MQDGDGRRQKGLPPKCIRGKKRKANKPVAMQVEKSGQRATPSCN